MGSVLSKASGLYDNWYLFLVKLKAIPRSGNDCARGRLYDKICFKLALWLSLFLVKLQAL